MIWNYRVVQYRNGSGFGLCEVYYDDKGKPFAMTEPAQFVCDKDEGAEQIGKAMRMALRDLRRMPVLKEPRKWPGKMPGHKEEKRGKLLKTEERTVGYLQRWLKNPKFKAAVTRQATKPPKVG